MIYLHGLLGLPQNSQSASCSAILLALCEAIDLRTEWLDTRDCDLFERSSSSLTGTASEIVLTYSSVSLTSVSAGFECSFLIFLGVFMTSFSCLGIYVFSFTMDPLSVLLTEGDLRSALFLNDELFGSEGFTDLPFLRVDALVIPTVAGSLFLPVLVVC